MQWLRIDDLCARYGCSRATIYRHIKEHKLLEPSYPFGAKTAPVWQEAELDKFDLDAAKKAAVARKANPPKKQRRS
jgi:predicted DNA-binding transcriptional regulator AlpA